MCRFCGRERLNVGATGDRRFHMDAFAAAWAADHDRALASLHNASWPGSNVMRARVYARKGLLDRTIAEKDRAFDLRADPEEMAELATIVAVMLGGRGSRVEAILALHAAELLVDDIGDRTLLAQYRLAVAQVELSSGNMADARAALELSDSYVDAAHLRDYRLETNHVRARIFELRAQLHALDFDYAAQLDDLCRAIATAKLVRHRDLWHEAGLLAGISTVIGTFPERSASLLLAASIADVRWTSHLDSRESTVRFNLARSNTLFGTGDDPRGVPGRGAPSLAARLALDADRLLFDDWLDADHYRRDLDFASSLAESVDWENVTGEEILGLATLALLLAPYDLTQALAVKSLYDRMLCKLSREAQSFLEPRRVAFDDFVFACLAKALGDDVTALDVLDDCIAFWSARGMDPWCAVGALERFSISHDDADRAVARRFVAGRPRSRFSARLRRALVASETQSFPYLRAAEGPAEGPAAE
jgi:hypothetical protein